MLISLAITRVEKEYSMTMNRSYFMALVAVSDANPNGDPLNGNRPRQHADGKGYITDVCIKRKIRNRMQDMGRKILIVSDDRVTDGFKSIHDRLDGNEEFANAKKSKDKDKIAGLVCDTYEDVRAFGATIALKNGKKSDSENDGISVGIRAAVTIQEAESVDPVDVVSTQITKSTNSETGDRRGSDTMGLKHSVRFGLYVIKGSINPLFAEKNGFSEQDKEDIQQALDTLFLNDESAARPAGSIEVVKTIWWEGGDVIYPASRIFNTVQISHKDGVELPESYSDYEVSIEKLPEMEEPIVHDIF